jgi:C-terminal processing protease CtpA/Prc
LSDKAGALTPPYICRLSLLSKEPAMFVKIPNSLAACAGAGLLTLGLILSADGQNRPTFGSTKAAAANAEADRQAVLQERESQQRRDGIRGVREQEQAARRTSNQLNRDARQEAREQAIAQTTGQNQAGGNLAVTSQPGAQTNAALNANLRGPDLGVWLSNPRGSTGLLVNDISNQSSFAQAGLLTGDQIVSINGRPVASEAQFVQMLLAPGQLQQNQTASLVVLRNGQQQTLTIQPALLAQSVIAADPFFQVGLLVDQNNPNQNVVQRVFPRTAAFYAGLRPGDVITGLNGQAITSADALAQALTGAGATDLALAVSRNGQTRQLTLDASGDGSIRTALRPDTGTGIRSTAVGGATTTGGVTTTADATAPGAAAALGTAAAPGTGVTTGTAGTGVGVDGTVAGVGPSDAASGALSGTSPSAIGATAPAIAQPGIGGVRTAVPGVRTAVPGVRTTAPGLPGTTGGATGLAPSATGQGGNIAPSPAVSAFGSPSATGATGTTGGAGATAGGIGATGGTGALPGGAGSTAGPSGGATGTGLGGVGTSGAGTSAAGATGTGTGTGTGGTGAGAGGAGAGAGGAGAGGT